MNAVVRIKPDPQVLAFIFEESLFLFRMKMIDAKLLPRKRKKAAKIRIYKEMKVFMQKRIHNYIRSLTLPKKEA